MSSFTARAASRPWAAGLVVLVIGHLVFIATRHYVPGGDWAFIHLRTSDVLSADTPLTGAWSRYGWNHPGPLLYQLLALPQLLTGGSWQGLWLGALALNVAALAVAVRLLEPADPIRPAVGSGIAGWLTAWAIALAGLWTFAAGTSHLATDPWNASVVVLPVLTMVAATAAVLFADRRGVAVAAVVFVAAAQTHAAYGVLFLPLVLVALSVGLVRWRRYTLTWTGIGAVLMLPALVDTLVNWPGNFFRSIRFTLTASEPAVGFAEAARVIGRATSLSFFGEARLPSFVAVVSDPPWGLVPFAGLVALALAHRLAVVRGWTLHRRSLEATALLWLGGLLMVARTRGPLLIWLTTWMVAAAAVTWCLVGGVAVRWLVERRRAVPTVPGRPEVRAASPSSACPSGTDPAGADPAGADPAGATLARTASIGSTSIGSTSIGSTSIGSTSVAAPSVGAASAGVVALVALVLAALNVAGSVGEGYPFQEFTPIVQQFADDAEPYASAPIAIDLAGDEYVAGAVQSGLIVELEARDLQPRGRPDQRLQLGSHRTDVPLVPPSLLVRVEPQSGVPDGATVVSVSDPLSAGERAEADALMIELGALLDAAGMSDRRELLVNDLAPLAAFEAPPEVAAELARFERLGELHARGKRIVLYLVG